jgi:hypothetical protein
MFDFTLTSYSSLLKTLLGQDFSFQTFEEFITNPNPRAIVLRHDIDKNPGNALLFAKIENKLGIKASYHFRINKESNDPVCIKKIVLLQHEVGYHYEGKREKLASQRGFNKEMKSLEEELLSFNKNLKYFRRFYPVKVISMHGNPLSKLDSRKLWRYYDYRESGVICEPYFDIDYTNILYITDTGRRWDGNKFNIRDKALSNSTFLSNSLNQGLHPFQNWVVKPVSGSLMDMTQESVNFQNKFKFRSTLEIVRSAIDKKLPNQIIINTHPQRWTDKPIPWMRELVYQNIKNVGKFLLIKIRNQPFLIDNSPQHTS